MATLRKPMKVIGTFIAAQHSRVLRVGPASGPQVCLVVTEGSDKDIPEEFVDIFTGVGKLNDYQLKIIVNKDVTPVAQQVWRLLFSLRDKGHQKLDDLLDKDITEEVPNTPTAWVSPLVVAPKQDGDEYVKI